MLAHIDVCQLSVIPCPYAGIGCNFQVDTLKEETFAISRFFAKILNLAKNSETFNLRKFILAKYSKIGYSRNLIPGTKNILTKFFELD